MPAIPREIQNVGQRRSRTVLVNTLRSSMSGLLRGVVTGAVVRQEDLLQARLHAPQAVEVLKVDSPSREAAFTNASTLPMTVQLSTCPLIERSRTPGRLAKASALTGPPKSISSLRRARSLSVEMASTASSLPSRMIPTRSQRCSTSGSWCDEMNTVRPSVRTSSHRCSNSSCTKGSRPAVGSSRINRSGLIMNAATRPTFCLLPRDMLLIFLAGSSSRRSISFSR